MDVARFRQLMPVTREWAYFDHAAVAPLPQPAQEAVAQWAREATEQGDVVWSRWAQAAEATRRRAAALIGARPDEVALVPNTTSGITFVAEGFRWQAGDNIVTLANEFPSNLYPWMNLASRGVETRRVTVRESTVDLHELMQACDDRTRIIAVSWVSYSNGYRLDVDELVELAHARGILVMLDAIQGVGVFPLDVQQSAVDFLAADGHKWMLGPEGAGLLYIRHEHLDRLRAFNVGWHSVVHSHDFSKIELTLRPEAARYEGGSQNMVGMIGFGASLEVLMEMGLSHQASAIAEHVLGITDEACARLQAIGATIHSVRSAKASSGILSFELPGYDPQVVRQLCLEAKVVLSCRAGRLRISPHGYCSNDDLDRLTEALGYAIKRLSG